MAADFITDASGYVVDAGSPLLARAIHFIGLDACSLDGLVTVFDFGQNPASVRGDQLPALLFAPASLQSARVGGLDTYWRTIETIDCLLLCAEFDAAASVIRPGFIEPAAMLFGDMLLDRYNSGPGATARRRELCAHIRCFDILIDGPLTYGVTQYGRRGYVSWQFAFQVTEEWS